MVLRGRLAGDVGAGSLAGISFNSTSHCLLNRETTRLAINIYYFGIENTLAILSTRK
jgi:hypothetical protein